MAAGNNFSEFLLGLRAYLSERAPADQLDLFDVFAQEAQVAREWLEDELRRLSAGASLLEVGGGLMLLSAGLQREGYAMTVLEPISNGFSEFSGLQARVLEYATQQGHAPRVVPCEVEKIDFAEMFDFAFSFNVMEHVLDVAEALQRIGRSLKFGARYRFTCPNYSFPYEPHFNIPTLFSKDLTARVFRRAIEGKQSLGDPAGLWHSLNWITAASVQASVARLDDYICWFDKRVLARALRRVLVDPQFSARRPRWLTGAARLILAVGAERLLCALPMPLQPILDCTVARGQGRP